MLKEDILMARRAVRNSAVDPDREQELDMQPTKKVCETLSKLKNDINKENPKNKKVLLTAVGVLETFLKCNQISDKW